MHKATADLVDREQQRHDQAEMHLKWWGRWVTSSSGYGQSVLANLQASRATEQGDNAPINEAQASITDDAVRSLGIETYRMAVGHWGRGYSQSALAGWFKVAPATVKRRMAEVTAAVAHWKPGREPV